MVFTLENLSVYLGYFGDIISWVAATFIDVVNILLDSAFIIPIGIGLALLIIGYAYSKLKSIGAGGR